LRHVFPFEIFGMIPIAAISGNLQTSLEAIALDAAELQPGAEIGGGSISILNGTKAARPKSGRPLQRRPAQWRHGFDLN
jgi:hypothetical protein